ncbi:hypothetical protein ACO0LD_10765 [Undibacterium sp. Ji83W]|uniref:hypothetical protein n=1 Tax=Undibacterium sp. Ji83W TaxID=3413043 RepID=UPI003BF441E0
MLAAPYQPSLQRNELQILLGVLLLHAGLYLLWPQLNALHKDELTQANSGSLIFLKQPEQVKLPDTSPARQDVTKSFRPGRTVTSPRQDSAADDRAKPVSDQRLSMPPVEKESASPEADRSVVGKSVNRDTRDIFNGLKKDFQYRDQVSAKAAPAAMEKFGAAVQSSSTVMRESYKHEVHILGDGRPVSKVITPFGTYCILHRKPGEIIGNELRTVPVTCGNL